MIGRTADDCARLREGTTRTTTGIDFYCSPKQTSSLPIHPLNRHLAISPSTIGFIPHTEIALDGQPTVNTSFSRLPPRSEGDDL